MYFFETGAVRSACVHGLATTLIDDDKLSLLAFLTGVSGKNQQPSEKPDDVEIEFRGSWPGLACE